MDTKTFGILFALSLMASTAELEGQNLLHNPGFEDPSGAYWTRDSGVIIDGRAKLITGPYTTVSSASAYGLIAPGAEDNSRYNASQLLAATPGQQFTLSGWVLQWDGYALGDGSYGVAS